MFCAAGALVAMLCSRIVGNVVMGGGADIGVGVDCVVGGGSVGGAVGPGVFVDVDCPCCAVRTYAVVDGVDVGVVGCAKVAI